MHVRFALPLHFIAFVSCIPCSTHGLAQVAPMAEGRKAAAAVTIMS